MPKSLSAAGPWSSAELSPNNRHSNIHDDRSSDSSELVHLSRLASNDTSRRPSPAVNLPHPDSFTDSNQQDDGSNGDDSDFENWGDGAEGSTSLYEHDDDMPSDLRPDMSEQRPQSQQRQPLLDGDGKDGHESPTRPSLGQRRSTHFRKRESDEEAKNDTRKRYTLAAGFLLVSLVSFAVQTETAVYIQHDLDWTKPYCMLYFTHGSWSLLWPAQLLILRLTKWNQPWDAFWRRHLSILRSTGQMIEHRTLHVPSHLQKKSPIPYFIRTTAFVTCALTVAGGSWYVAVDLTTASDLTAIYNCSAFFAYAFAVPLLGEKLRLSKIVAVGIAILGVLVVAYGDSGTAKHGNKSGGGAGGPSAPDESEANDRTLGNLVIGIGSVLYGFYEVLYKRVACPPDGCSPDRGMVFANAVGSMIGTFTLLVLWIPLPILHITGIETFELPTGEAAWMLLISVLANATFSGSFLVLISLTSPVLSSVAALLTIFLVALCDEMLPPPLHNSLTGAAIAGGLLIIFAFFLLSYETYKEMDEERRQKPEERVEESDIDEP